ncbi:MAG: hypothetical protein R3F46_03610 [bacterium]
MAVPRPDVDTLYEYLDGNMREPASVGNRFMPRFELTDSQRLAIVTALLAEPLDGSQRLAPLRSTPAADPQLLKSGWQAYWEYPVPPQGSGNPGSPGWSGTCARRAARSVIAGSTLSGRARATAWQWALASSDRSWTWTVPTTAPACSAMPY